MITVGAGGNASGRGFWLGLVLGIWIHIGRGGGQGTESSQGYELPDGTRYKPDLAWINPATLLQIKERYGAGTNWPEYLPFTPAFIVEIASPSDKQRDNLAQQRAKCAHWTEQGVQVAWLIDPFDQAVHVYRPNREPETHQHPDQLEVGPEMPGLNIDLGPVWQ